jgi:threonine dehydrogenase-like Zn-dependent dehydrogenase
LRAVVKSEAGPGRTRCTTHADPTPGPDEVVIRVRRAGVCGTDLSFVRWTQAARTGYRPSFPQVIGHELAGEVADDHGSLSAGAPVTASPHVTCGACRYCLSGRSMLCPSRRVLGLDADGAFAEYVAVPRRNVVGLPEGIDWDVAALAEPFTVAVHTVERVRVGPGDTVAVIGPGSIGLCTIAALLRCGAGAVFAVGREEDRLQLEAARRLGARPAIADSAAEVVADETSGAGVDVAIETAGAPAAVQLACSLVRPGGAIGIVGLCSKGVELDVASLAFAEHALIGVRAYDLGTWRRTPRLLAALADQLRPLVTHRLPLEAFDTALAHVADRTAIKVLLDPAARSVAVDDPRPDSLTSGDEHRTA